MSANFVLPTRTFDLERSVVVMGIVNVTPDSFYDGGLTADPETAVKQALTLASEGAAIVDIGGVKAGPGEDVSIGEEIDRVLPVVTGVRAASDVTISVDTWRSEVADAVLSAGADIVNDISGAADPEILDVVASHDAGYVAVHRGGPARGRPFRRGYTPDVVSAVVDHLRDLVERAESHGVHRDRIVTDPGHDLGKTTYHSLELTRRLDDVVAIGRPVLVALSNKDFIGETLDAPINARTDGSIAAAVFAVLQGARIVRVHEVRRTLDAVVMTEALLGWRSPRIAVRGLE